MSDAAPCSPPPALAAPAAATDFLKGVAVRLPSGVDYCGPFRHPACADGLWTGVLSRRDGYMNIALEPSEEHVGGTLTNRYGDAFVRGNNGPSSSPYSSCSRPLSPLSSSPLHIGSEIPLKRTHTHPHS